jgi:beta-galactosidase
MILTGVNSYVANAAATIAKGQITNGGPIILYQPENEYSGACCGVDNFPDGDYVQYVEDQARNAGVIVPMISNDAWAGGHDAPGTGAGAVDIYGHDSYPLGFDCASPYTWPSGDLPTDFYTSHMEQSPNTPYSIVEVCPKMNGDQSNFLMIYSSKAEHLIPGEATDSWLVRSS